jgi:hypothetical protein
MKEEDSSLSNKAGRLDDLSLAQLWYWILKGAFKADLSCAAVLTV